MIAKDRNFLPFTCGQSATFSSRAMLDHNPFNRSSVSKYRATFASHTAASYVRDWRKEMSSKKANQFHVLFLVNSHRVIIHLSRPERFMEASAAG
jgi:hypothetical protein